MDKKKYLIGKLRFVYLAFELLTLILCYLLIYINIKSKMSNGDLVVFSLRLGIILCVKFIISIVFANFYINKVKNFLGNLVKDIQKLAFNGIGTLKGREYYNFAEFSDIIKAFSFILRKKEDLENELVLMVDDMENRVVEKTKDLSNSIEEAKSVAKSKDAMLAYVSHEIRSPMSSIIGMCELLINESIPVTAENYAKNIIKESESLIKITNNLLSQAKSDSERVILDKTSINVEEFVKRVITLGINNNRHNLNIDYILETDIPDKIYTDEVKLYQIVSNIFFNALKFTLSGSVTIYVSYTKPVLEFNIVDTGIGIPIDRIDYIFEKYKQLDSNLTIEYRGAGLGLYITKNLVELMNGSINVLSEPGNGSCFSVTIPVDEIYSADKQEEIKILVVEDYSTNRMIVKRHLESVGYHVTEAVNGQEAVDMANREKYDIILMDIQMPVLNGYDSTLKIRAEGLNRGTPIIAMTANGIQVVGERCMSVGMNDILLKPIKKSSFIECIQKYLKGDICV